MTARTMVPRGFRRAWFRCRRCGATEEQIVKAFDIGGPMKRLACGHADDGNFFDVAEPIDRSRHTKHLTGEQG